MNLIYFLRPKDADGPIKIGHSVAPGHRLKTYQAWSPVPLELAATLDVPGDDGARRRSSVLRVEKRFHLKYAASRLHHEWFAATPELLADIAAIQMCTFAIDSLPVWTPIMELVAQAKAQRLAA